MDKTSHRDSFAGGVSLQMTASGEGLGAIRASDVIRKKRDGRELSRAEIRFIVDGYTRESIPDYQASAWLMATLLRGLDPG